MTQQSKSLLIVGTFLSQYGGTRSVCEDLADALESDGWAIIRTSQAKSSAYRVWDMIKATWKHRHVYSAAQIDVYSGRAFIWAELVSQLLVMLNKPVILTLHGGQLPQFASKWPGRVRRLMAQAKYVTTPSTYLFKDMQAYCPKLIIVPNSIDLKNYTYRKREPIAPQLIWLRSFHHIYNPQMAIHVVNKVKKHYPAVQLKMIGPDKGDGALQATTSLCAKLNLDKSIEFVGPVQKKTVPMWLDKGDIFINTTHADNTPVSVLEALASGLCVVSTNVGGIPDLLENGKTAMLVNDNDIEGMAQAVVRLVQDQELVENLSTAGKALAQQYSRESVMDRWRQLFEEVIG